MTSSFTRKFLFFNISLLYPILFLLIFFIITLFANSPKNIDISRFLFFEYILLYSIFLVIILFNIRIKFREKDEADINKFLKLGKIQILHSHHDEKQMNHEIKIRNRFFCTGCYGIGLGFLLSELPGGIYILYFNQGSMALGVCLILVGYISIFISLVKYLKPVFGILRLLSNSCLPIGIWFVVIGVDILFQNMFSLIYSICIITYFILVRLFFSVINHEIEETTNKQTKEQSRKLRIKELIVNSGAFLGIGLFTGLIVFLLQILKKITEKKRLFPEYVLYLSLFIILFILFIVTLSAVFNNNRKISSFT